MVKYTGWLWLGMYVILYLLSCAATTYYHEQTHIKNNEYWKCGEIQYSYGSLSNGYAGYTRCVWGEDAFEGRRREMDNLTEIEGYHMMALRDVIFLASFLIGAAIILK